MLSRPRVTLDDEPVTDFVSDKALALLCYLALNKGQQPRQRLAGLLWGELPAKRARANLRVVLHNLRQLLPGYLAVTRESVAFADEQAHWIDVKAFAGSAAEHDPDRLVAAVALYEDDFLAGMQTAGAPELETWLVTERERLSLKLVQILERLAAAHAEREQWAEAVRTTRHLLAVEPWREQSHRQLMLLLARQGQYAAALAQYARCREALTTELDVDPMPETERLAGRIRRLRDRPLDNLPVAPAPLVGREAELHLLRQRLKDPGCRLLTLFGPGGIGKTRLALALGASVRPRFLDGVFYVPLSDVEAPCHVPLVVGQAMSIPFAGPRPPADQLLERLAGRELLLIFDNFEQLLEGATFVERLLATVDGVRVLAVSRAVLKLPGECPFEVSGLSLPQLTGRDLEAAPAARLFLQQARRQQPAFSPEGTRAKAIARICHLVEGYPLALEQAASWLRVLKCSDLARELEQGLLSFSGPASPADPRRQSMRAVLEQSWRLLGTEERATFSRLAVFRGGFTLEGARKVAGASIPLLAALVDHSLLRFEETSGRYEMHEVLRQFAATKLAADPAAEAAVRDRHAAHFAQFLSAKNKTAFSPDEAIMLRTIQQEMENVRATWQHALSRQQSARLATFLQSFWYFHELLGLYREGEEVFRSAVEKLSAAENVATEAGQRALGLASVYYGWFQMRTGNYVAATKWSEQGVARLRACCPESLPGWPVFCLGFTLQLRGDYARSEALVQESVALHRNQGNENGLLHSESSLAYLWLATGEVKAAQAQIERVTGRWAHRTGRRMLSNLYLVRGVCALALGNPDRAEAFLQEGLASSHRGGDRWNVALCTHYLGLVAGVRGDFAAAREQHGQALALMEGLDEKLGITFCLLGLGWAEQGLGSLAASRNYFDDALRVAAAIQVPPQMLEALAGIGACLLAGKETEQARALLSLVTTHPATAYPVRRRAATLLNRGAGGLQQQEVPATAAELEQMVSNYL